MQGQIEKMMIQQPPFNPIEAVIHPDPYTYYADLVTNRPIYWDERAGCWIAASAATVTAVLTNKLCLVRPPAEPVPTALLGSPAADIFRQLVRMNEGQKHGCLKGAVSSTLQAFDAAQVIGLSNTWARFLVDEMAPEAHSDHLADFAFHLPVYVIASLLGIPQQHMKQTALWMSDFVRCLAPGSLPGQIEQGKEAAHQLLDLFRGILSIQEAEHASSGLSNLMREVRLAGSTDRDAVIANGIGFLSQAYEATAGLIGNTLLTLARHQDVYEQILADPARLHLVIQEVLRYDPPVQNTRRFLAGNGTVAGVEMKEGNSVLVVLAAANRDPDANRDPEQFAIFRQDRRLFTFGTGEHACPGEMVAALIARAGVAHLIQSGLKVSHLAESFQYRPSANTRVPLFKGEIR
jgi:cytochrome P450